MSVIPKSDIIAATQGDATGLKKVLTKVDDSLVRLQNQGGFNLATDDPTQLIGTPPQPPSWTVAGVDGKFIVRIAPPQLGLNKSAVTANGNAPGDPSKFTALPITVSSDAQTLVNVLYQFQSSLTSGFDSNGAVLTYPAQGASQELAYDIADHPNEIRYWRIRARYLNSNFTTWYSLLGPGGALAVDSSFERSTTVAPRSPLNRTNDSTIDSINVGATDTIRVYKTGSGPGSSVTMFDGQGGQIVIGSATILGANLVAFYSVVWDPKNHFQAFPAATQYKKTLADALYFLASIQTVDGAGAGGFSGGGGTTGSGQPGHESGALLPDLGST